MVGVADSAALEELKERAPELWDFRFCDVVAI